jgi:PAS domain S-box-containing protein
LVDASIGAWRRGNRHRAVLVGGGTVLFTVIGGVHAPLVDFGVIPTPYMVSFAFLAIVLTMSYELVNDAILSIRYARQIEASNQRWNTLLEKVPLLVAGVNQDGCIDYVNSSFLRVSGYKREEIYGRDLTELLPELTRADAVRAFSEAMRGRLTAQVERVLQTKSGDQRQVRWSNVLLTNGDGSPAGVLSIGSDITEQLAAQGELQQTRREMEHLSRVTMLGELAASLAHELNQPLAAMLSNAQAARRFLASGSPDLTELGEILDDIILDDKRAGEVIHRLRSMLGKGESSRETLKIGDVAEDVAKLVTGEIKAEGIVLTLDFTPDLPDLQAGRIEIQQVLMNLILNAVHAMKSSPGKIREITIRSRIENEAILVSVVDNGCGVEAGFLPTLFDAFVTTKSSGMGMGLAICRRIVEAHGGKIWAESNTAGGATFSFTLPIERHEEISASV